MVTACIVLLYISYCIPVICLLKKGRNNIKHGPFWLGGFGHFCNYVLLLWTLFTLVMYSFPYTMPVTPDTMNYVCVVYFVVLAIGIIYWITRGKTTFRSRDERVEEVDNIIHQTISARR